MGYSLHQPVCHNPPLESPLPPCWHVLCNREVVQEPSPQLSPGRSSQHSLTHAPYPPATNFASFYCRHIFKQSQNSVQRVYVLSSVQKGSVWFRQCCNEKFGVQVQGHTVCSQAAREPGPVPLWDPLIAQPSGCTGQRFVIYFCQFSLTHDITVKDDCSFFALSPFSLLLLCWCRYFSVA